ncbi:methyl-accepting chemotaxis protein [Sphingomonas kyeonggiensis]|uniref:Methyl-accepting chemotaxis protein n=1 Tax=Sphingomonas kyeonggiensis TaxID=1268553 RepID=A0A7W7K6U9_9SPHN|nr:methyl-accepting chemotaxis protein [Sphingomonas kyeonggiensis]MBB4841485.1 methyl-accepting chemotaxis protein [Sphingomonas kyeonggiensis]
MLWFREKAPIRQKTLVAFGSLVALMALLGLIALALGDFVMAGFSACAVLAAAVMSASYRKAICDPYVNTVIRMEGLAAGDLASPIAYTNHEDCVGRMTRAMFTFRDAAAKQMRDSEAQAQIVEIVGESLAQLSTGNLTGEIAADFPDAYASLKTNFNSALESMRSLIGTVLENAQTIRTGSGEIAQASEDLARRTEANAASLQETSASVTQMDERLKESASAAARTLVRADEAIATVSTGRGTADEAVQAMNRVSESAEGIDSVIEGLDKIAFQTRVLAMNAAVEAGRAGEAGRGFAVVADLVSALAMRAEEEAGRAREQLTATQTDILAAVDMVQKVDTALVDISQNVEEVHDLLGRMATDNQAQSTAITQINVAISEMDHATQQNAAMVEQTSAAARNLSGEVILLAEQAARFEIGTPKGGHSYRAEAVPSPAVRGLYARPRPTHHQATSNRAVDTSGGWASF